MEQTRKKLSSPNNRCPSSQCRRIIGNQCKIMNRMQKNNLKTKIWKLLFNRNSIWHGFSQQNGCWAHTSAGISMGYAAKESIISEIDTATVFLSTATRPRQSEWYIITPVPKKCWECTPSSMHIGGTCTYKIVEVKVSQVLNKHKSQNSWNQQLLVTMYCKTHGNSSSPVQE